MSIFDMSGFARSHESRRRGPADVRAFKIPVLSKLRIGGSVGKTAEGVKSTLNNTKVLGVPLGAGLAAVGGGGLGSVALAENSRAGGDWSKTGQFLKEDLTQGAKNVPLALGIAKATGGAGGLKSVGAGASGTAGGDVITGYEPNGEPIYGAGAAAGSGGSNGILDFLREHGVDIAKLGLTAAAGYEGVKNSQQAAALNKDALAKLNAPLTAPDLNYIFNDPGNPFQKGRLPVVGRK